MRRNKNNRDLGVLHSQVTLQIKPAHSRKSDIEERRRSPQSMMPDGLLTPLNPGEVRNLIAYVSGSGQVSLPPSTLGPSKGSGPR